MKSAVCVIVRDEERDFAEWLAYQFVVGFDTVLVYDNGSTDRTPEIARDFAERLDVRLTHWPHSEKYTQLSAYEHCVEMRGSEFDWVAFFDADELVVPRQGDIKTVLAANAEADAVAFNWAMFGSSGHATRPPGLMVETFQRRAKSDFRACCYTKSIVRPGAISGGIPNPHAPGGNCRTNTPGGRPVSWGRAPGISRRAEHSVAQLNHYFTRSRAEYQARQARYYPGRRRGGWRVKPFAVYDRNELLDRSALRFVAAVRDILAGVGAVDCGGIGSPPPQNWAGQSS